MNLHGGKADQMGIHGYGKRFAPNWLEVENCFVTAVGRILFSRAANDTSSYLYMSETEAVRFEKSTQAKIDRNATRAEPVRVRQNGPHTRFRVHFKRGIKKMVAGGHRFPFNPNLVTPHSKKKTGYKRVKRLHGVNQQDVNGRADHRSGNVFTYGHNSAAGDLNSGGPNERADFSMAKTLANFDLKTISFNQNPPHFSDDFIETIEFEKILPCFENLPKNIIAVLPLILAQLIHHYHHSLDSLGDQNPLRLSPLWNDQNGILYRHHLYANLQGICYGQNHIKGRELRDINSDTWVMNVANLQNQVAMMEDLAQLLPSSTNAHACSNSKLILSEVTGVEIFQQPAASQNARLLTPRSNRPDPSPAVQGAAFLVLEQAAPPFKMPSRLTCKFAFYRMHTRGTDRLGLWREKDGGMIDDSVVGAERKAMRELFNKAASVCKMIQGPNSPEEIDQIGVDSAWTLCSQKVNQIWFSSLHFNILGQDGSAAVRTVSYIMHGHDTTLSPSLCLTFVQQCLSTPIAKTQSLKQSSLSFIKAPVSSIQETKEAPAPDAMEDNDYQKQEHDVLDLDDSVECYVCEVCRPNRLYRDWADYTRCARQHFPQNLENKKRHFFKDDVRTVMARKINPNVSTSQYVACGTPTFKQYSAEEKLFFFRQKIIHAGLLKQNDRIEIKLTDTGSTKQAIVLSGQLLLKNKSWGIDVAILSQDVLKLDTECPGTEFIWVASILSRIPNKRVVTPKSSYSFQPRQDAASAAQTMQSRNEHICPERKVEVTPFNLHKVAVTPLKLHNVFDNDCPRYKRPNTTQEIAADGPTQWKQLGDAACQLNIGARIMLRAVAEEHHFFIPKHILPQKGKPAVGSSLVKSVSFPMFVLDNASFIESDLGLKFRGIYPDNVQKVLDTFKLDETNRCFFLSLGIATNNDPFLLQRLFRKHAKYLDLNKELVLRFIGDGDNDEALKTQIRLELDEAISITTTDSYVDCCALRFFWPVEFDNLRIVIICKRGTRVFQKVFNASGTQTCIQPDDAGKKTIFLKLENGHYTILTFSHGHMVVDNETDSWFLHEVDVQLRCPSTTTMQFEIHASDESYLATAVKGIMPSEDDVNRLYQQVISGLGIVLDENGTWLHGLPQGISTSDWNQQGSLVPASWNKIRNALVQEHEKEIRTEGRARRSFMQSPGKSPAIQPSETPLVFLDVGSESGRGLVKMLHDSRISHVAGIELQAAWFHLSVSIFRQLRTLFIEAGFRMPYITIFRSCLMSPKPELVYIYSICSIAFVNNAVWDKKPYFVAHKGANLLPTDLRNAPLKDMGMLNDTKKMLSPNAAFTLSKGFHNSTSIVVLQPEFFNAQFDYGNAVSYPVTATWTTNFNTPSTTVTLLTHTQHVNIARGVRLACVSQKFVRLWQEYMRKWSSSLQLAYSIMRDPKYIHKRKVAIGHQEGKYVHLESDESCDDDVDTSDLDAVLPDIQELQSTDKNISMNIQSLASLHPTHMLSEYVLQAYMVLLEAGVPHIFFPHLMTCIYQKLRISRTQSKADNQALCREYLFRRKTPTDRSTFIFALNPGLHWIAFKVDFSKKYIASMCSLQDPLHETANAILHCISSVYPQAASFEHFSVTVPNQNNAVDCGPLCCMFMLYLSQTDISRSSELSYATHSTASAMRLRIFADIAQKRLTPLVTNS